MKTQKHAYLLRVAHSLAACQIVEFELKYYITRALEMVQKWIAGRMAFKMAGVDYKDASLERLIEAFKKLSSNPALLKELTRFKDDRNFVAHKAILACLDSDGELKHALAAKLESRLKRVEKDAARLTEAIYEESLKFVVHEYLDDPKG